MKSAQDRSTDDGTAGHWWTRHRRPQLKRPVGTIVVVVTHELGEQRKQMPLIQHDDVVKTLLAKGPHYPFRDRIRQRRPIGRSDICDADASKLGGKVTAVDLVSVVDQVSRLTAPGSGFERLSQIHAAVGLAVTLR